MSKPNGSEGKPAEGFIRINNIEINSARFCRKLFRDVRTLLKGVLKNVPFIGIDVLESEKPWNYVCLGHHF
jgi:hypothetical protein